MELLEEETGLAVDLASFFGLTDEERLVFMDTIDPLEDGVLVLIRCQGSQDFASDCDVHLEDKKFLDVKMREALRTFMEERPKSGHFRPAA